MVFMYHRENILEETHTFLLSSYSILLTPRFPLPRASHIDMAPPALPSLLVSLFTI
jgi:hypothetical protein